MESKEIQQLVQLSQHLITDVEQICIGPRIQSFGEIIDQNGDISLDQLHHRFLREIGHFDGVRAGRDPRTSILPHIHFHILVDTLIQSIDNRIGGLVPGVGLGLPVIELDLLTHSEKKIDVAGAHGLMLPYSCPRFVPALCSFVCIATSMAMRALTVDASRRIRASRSRL